MLTSEIAAAVSGTIVGPDVEVEGATQDSRELVPGNLFVPVVAERDGHDFVDQAVASGAAAYFTAQPGREVAGSATAIVVEETELALQALGMAVRKRLAADVVGVTGSAGKTSTKDLIAAAVAADRSTHASVKSLNNELGVPLTLFNAPADTACAVVEMGARGTDHIRFLCYIAQPTIGVVTTVGMAHTSEFGSFEAVVQGKGELIESLPIDGLAVLNAMVPEVTSMSARTSARSITFGIGMGDVRAVEVTMNDDLTSTFTIESDWETFDVALGARGEHNVANAAAAAAVALSVGVPGETIAAGLAAPEWSPWRMEVATSPSGLTVVNDAYNANPLSVIAALESLAKIPAERRVAMLGVMGELGDAALEEHRRVASVAEMLGIEIIAIDAPDYGAEHQVADRVDASVKLKELGVSGPGNAVLVKGSRVAGLEVLAEVLLRD